MEFGKSLRAAREEKGYSIGQLAEMTHMSPLTIEDLEKDDFRRIAAPIYGRGFVKLYCQAVGLDPQPFIDEFMNILTGNHAPSIKERIALAARALQEEVRSSAVPPASLAGQTPAPEQAPAAETPATQANPLASPDPLSQGNDDPNAFHLESDPLPAGSFPELSEDFLAPLSRPPASPQPAGPSSAKKISLPHIPSAVWRVGMLAFLVLAFLAAVFLGLRALYRATSPADDSRSEPERAQPAEVQQATPPPAPAQDAAAPQKQRVQQDIPALYLD